MAKLTEKEIEVLKLTMKGYSNKEIASQLFITVHTVKAHLTSVFKKLNVKNRTSAAFVASNYNMFDE